jgi:hypothetical protein
MRRLALVALAGLVLAAPATAGAAGPTLTHAQKKALALKHENGAPSLLEIRTIPVVPGATFLLDGKRYVAGRDGTVQARVRDLIAVTGRMKVPAVHEAANIVARFKQWHGHLNAKPARKHGGILMKQLTATYDVYYHVKLSFADDLGRRPPDPIRTVVLHASTGVVQSFTPTRATVQGRWIWGKRVVPYHDTLQVKPVYWVIDRVGIDGSNVVNQSQQKIFPAQAVNHVYRVRLLYYSAAIHVRDSLLPVDASSKVKLRFPDGSVRIYPLSHGRLLLGALPRGHYDIKPVGFGIGFWAPVALSRDQVIDVRLISYFDLALVVIIVGGIAFALAAARRPALRRRAFAAMTLSRGTAR